MLMKWSYLFYEPVYSLADLSQRIQALASLGYQGIELSAAHPLNYAVDDVAALADRYRLPVVSLLSGWSYAHEGLCLSSPDAGVRARAVARLIEYVEQAGRLRAVLVVGLMQGLRRDEPDPARANERIADCLRQVARAAVDHGITIVIEPVNHLQVGFNHTAAEVAALVDAVASPGLGYMLDTIHMNIEERSILQTIRTHGPRIRHFHLCETNGAPFGTGNLDFAAVCTALREARYTHAVSVKIYRQMAWEEGVRSAAAFLRDHRLWE
jgi:sugar phosphate isomerase/epimerase